MAETIVKSVVVNRDVNHVYNLWSNFENFPNFMENIRSVTMTGDNISHWVMEGPMGKQIEWDARTTAQEPNRRIAWGSLRGDIKTTGQVQFKEQTPQQTEIVVELQYEPGGVFGETFAKLVDNPERKLQEDLQNFKNYAEQSGPGHMGRGAGQTGGTSGQYGGSGMGGGTSSSSGGSTGMGGRSNPGSTGQGRKSGSGDRGESGGSSGTGY